MIHTVSQINQIQRFFGWHGTASDFSDHCDILSCGQAGNQIVKLKHKTDMIAAVFGQFAFCRLDQIISTINHMAACRFVQTAQDIQQRRFAAARSAEQHDQFSLIQIEIDTAQGMNRSFTHLINLGNAARLKDGVDVHSVNVMKI